LGLVYYKKGFYDNAIGEFSDSLKLRPDNAMVHYHLGLTYFEKGDKKQAKTQLEKALHLDKKFKGADNARQILSKLG
jgi:tetratricopeptide (TPR) repeat protein